MPDIDLTNPIFSDEDQARAHLEAHRWPDGVNCPFCRSVDAVSPLAGASMGPGWYHCNACRDKFTVRVGSVMERSHIPLTRWALAFHLMAASKNLLTDTCYQRVDLMWQPATSVVCGGGGAFYDRIGSDHFARDQVTADAEMLQRALGLRAPKLVGRYFNLAQPVGFRSNV